MKKTIIHLFSVAAIGLALAACGGHHDHDRDGDRDRDRDRQDQSNTTSTSTTTETKTEKHSDEGNQEHKQKSDVPTEQGKPTVDTTLQEKPKDASTMGANTEKHHVKPGGVH